MYKKFFQSLILFIFLNISLSELAISGGDNGNEAIEDENRKTSFTKNCFSNCFKFFNKQSEVQSEQGNNNKHQSYHYSTLDLLSISTDEEITSSSTRHNNHTDDLIYINQLPTATTMINEGEARTTLQLEMQEQDIDNNNALTPFSSASSSTSCVLSIPEVRFNITSQNSNDTQHPLNLPAYDEQRDLYYYNILNSDEIQTIQRSPAPKNINGASLFSLDVHSDAVPFYIPKDLDLWKKKKNSDDGRHEIVPNFNDFPWTVHGCLMIYDNPSLYFASAILLNDQFLLTAAHNFYNRKKKTVSDRMAFYPGMSGDSTPPAAIKAKSIAIDQLYYESECDDNEYKNRDLALVALQTPIKDRGSYNILNLNEQTAKMKIKNVNVTGYPGVSPFWGRHMLSKEVVIKDIKDGIIHYNTKTRDGQSGGGVWGKEAEEDEIPALIGIHTHGDNIQNGSATFLNLNNISNITKWQKLLTEFNKEE